MTSEEHFDYWANRLNLQSRPYQRRIVSKLINYFCPTFCDDAQYPSAISSVMIDSPTGSGKTFMALLASKIIQHLHNDEIGVMYVSMRHNLLSQIRRDATKYGIDVHGLTSISMFQKIVPSCDIDGRPYKVVISDESHHDATSSMASIYNAIHPEFIIGLTATPFRLDNAKLSFNKVIRDAGISTLMEHGYLSKYDLYISESFDPETICQRYVENPQRWGKSAMYWHNRHEMNQCVHLLKMAGVRVASISGETPIPDRNEIMQKFENVGDDSIDVLVNMMVLTEGWSCDSLKTVWIRDASKGPTMQIGGRVLRVHEPTGIKQIVQSKNTKYPFIRVAKPRHKIVWEEFANGDPWVIQGHSDVMEKAINDVYRKLIERNTSSPLSSDISEKPPENPTLQAMMDMI